MRRVNFSNTPDDTKDGENNTWYNFNPTRICRERRKMKAMDETAELCPIDSTYRNIEKIYSYRLGYFHSVDV